MIRRALLACGSVAVLLATTISWASAQQAAGTHTKDAAQAVVVSSPVTASASPAATSSTGSRDSAKAAPVKSSTVVKNEPAAERIEGEKRYHTNCGRCHVAPEKFPPREMATIIRHMRVRATITDEDTRLILKYMTQ